MDMNRFTIGNCWNFGRMIPDEFKGTWDELMVHPEWQPFVDRHQLTQIQVAYIERGMKGMPFKEEVPQGELFPFSQHKGKPFHEVPEGFWNWLEKQDWIAKWPTVELEVKRRLKDKADKSLSKDDIKSLLHTIE